MKKQTIYEERRMRSKGAYHHFFKESGSTSWKYHNWEGPAIQPIEGEQSEYKKEYSAFMKDFDFIESLKEGIKKFKEFFK